MFAAGVVGDKAGEDGPARAQHGVGIHPAMQQGQGEPGPDVGQDAFEGRRGPADEVEQPALGAGEGPPGALALFGQPLQGMALRAGM